MTTAAAVLVAGLVGLTYWAAQGPPPPVEHEPVSILIADLDNTTGDPTLERHARADAQARARGRRLHQRLRPQRHPPQPRRAAARAARRGRRPRDCGQPGRRRRAGGRADPRGHGLRHHAQGDRERHRQRHRRRLGARRRQGPGVGRGHHARQPRAHGARRRHVGLGAALRHRDAVGHLARRRPRVCAGDAGALEQQVRGGAAELRTRRQARSELRPGLRRHGDRVGQHGPARRKPRPTSRRRSATSTT